MLGHLSLDQEQSLVKQAYDTIAAKQEQFSVAQSYLDSFQFWQAYGADDSPYVDHLSGNSEGDIIDVFCQLMFDVACS